MLKQFFCCLLFFSVFYHFAFSQTISRIAFGSCSSQNAKQDILYKIVEKKPDIFIYLGDNIYGDTKNMKVLQKKYDKLAAKDEFKFLNKNTQVLATWDDHDYGRNDAGKEYIKKEASKQVFLKFWKEPKDSERFKHKGIYHELRFGEQGKVVQIILLDTRTFRDKLKRKGIVYAQNYSKNVTFLGKDQWQWLEKQFQKPADIRIIASSNQFSHEYNSLESWTNMPLEQQKMLELIKKTKANGVFFISGDVHYGEISKLDNTFTYPIYDVTSSGLTKEFIFPQPNKNRLGKVVIENNFGLIEIDWSQNTKISLQLFDKNGDSKVLKIIQLGDLQSL